MSRRLVRLAAALSIFTVVIGIGGSSPVSETGSATGGPLDSMSPASGEVAPKGPSIALPSGGVPLTEASSCPPSNAPVTVASLQKGLDAVKASSWQAADGGVSARLGDGRVLWMYGDTLDKQGSVAANSMLLSSGSCFSQYVSPQSRAVIPSEGSGSSAVVTWPISVTAIDRGGWSEVIVFGNRVRRGADMLDFTLLGTSLSRFAVPNGQAPRLLEVRPLTDDDLGQSQITWGTSTAMDGRYLYVYGTQVVAGSLGRQVYVARTKWDGLPYASQWEYFGPTGWSNDASAKPILDAAPGASHIISVFSCNGSWYVMSKAGGDLGNDVGVWKASAPTGPFRLAKRIRRPYNVTANRIQYMPLAHPQLSSGGQVIASMSRNVTSGDGIQADPTLGRPEFFPVRLP